MIDCTKCQRRHTEPRVWPLICRCGARLGGGYVDDPAPVRKASSARFLRVIPPPELPCVHRGDELRRLDCGCEGNSTLYRCAVKGQCLLRPLPASTFRGATCDGCDARRDPRTSTAIITTHWNPWDRQRLRDTYAEWAAALGHPHLCVELAFGKPEIPGAMVVRGSWGNVLWQKERLINLAVSLLPEEIDYVAWIDHDLVFENPDWLDIGLDMVRRGVDCVQLFSEVHYQDLAGQVIRRARGSVAAWQSTGELSNSAPGGAWLASRSWLRSIGGIYDRNICGGGDATFLAAVTKCPTTYITRQAPRLRDHALAYGDRIRATAGYVPGVVRHLWHGDRANRQYISRDEILMRYDFDPNSHLQITLSGILELSPNAPAGLQSEIAAYFKARRDDG